MERSVTAAVRRYRQSYNRECHPGCLPTEPQDRRRTDGVGCPKLANFTPSGRVGSGPGLEEETDGQIKWLGADAEAARPPQLRLRPFYRCEHECFPD